MDKLILAFWSALCGALLMLGFIPAGAPPVQIYCPERQAIWQDVSRWASTAMNHCAEQWKDDDLDWCLDVMHENTDLSLECHHTCDGQVADLYDALVSAELQRGFDAWPSDQLVCDCFSVLVSGVETDLDEECAAAIVEVCGP